MKRGAAVAVARDDPRALLVAVESRLAADDVPARFTDFCAWLGVELTPGQRVIGLVAYDGVDPIDLPEADRAIARVIFGDVDRFTSLERGVVVVVCGARGGKTYVLVALRALHLALTVSLDTLAPGEVANAPLIAPGKDDAEQALTYIQGAVANCPALLSRVVGKVDAAESIKLRRGKRTVRLVVRAASARGRTGRGRNLVCAVLDEAAFFLDKNYKVNDEEIYQALSARILPGGQLIIDSTPWAQVGLLYELFAANHPNPEVAGLPARPQRQGTAIAVHAPTLVLRDVPLTREIVAREEARDPENALREFGAHFMQAGATTFFEPACIEACLDLTLELPLPREPGVQVAAGADMGLTKNSAALCIGHIRPDVTVVAELLERKPKPNEPLKPGIVAGEFVERVVAHGGTSLMADSHYRETIVEHATPRGLAVQRAPLIPSEEFVAVRARMREGRYRFPNNPRFLRQLRETIAIPGSGGSLTIRLQKWRTGEHGDLVIAFVHMAFQTCGVAVAPILTPEQRMRAETLAGWERDREEAQRAAREEEFGGNAAWWTHQ